MSAKNQALMQAGRDGEQILKSWLKRYGFRVEHIGQEYLLSQKARWLLRQQAGDPTAKSIRYMPDMFVIHGKNRFPVALWDAKHKISTGSPYFNLNRDFYFAQIARVSAGQRVVIAFIDLDGEIYAQWVEQLQSVDGRPRPSNPRINQPGYIRFRKNAFLPLYEFLKTYKKREWHR